MKSINQSPLLRTSTYFVPLIVLVFSLACYPLQSDDFFMYLALGRKFFATFSFPTLDPFLYSLNNYAWTILHQWLGYVIFYTVYFLGGIDLVIILKALFVTLAMCLPLFKVDRPVERFIGVLSVFLAIYGIAFRLMERTSLFSDFFIAALLLLLMQESQKPSRLKFCLPFLFLAWVNIHPAFPIGWGLCFLFLIVNWKQRQTKHYQQFLALTLASVLIGLVNPKGLDGVLYPFRFANEEGKVFRQYYFEWLPTLSSIYRFQTHTYFLVALSSLNLILLWFARKAKNYFETIASLFFIFYGFYAIRFVTTMGFSLIILNISLSQKVPELRWSKQLGHLLGAFCLILGLKNIFFGYQTISGPRKFGLGFDPNVIPVKAAEIIFRRPQIGNVFNSHMFGSYLAWAWLEQRKIFYHGFVTDTNLFLNEYAAFSSTPEIFHKQIVKYKIQAFLLDRFQGNERLLQNLVQDPGWALAYQDESSLIFLPLAGKD